MYQGLSTLATGGELTAGALNRTGAGETDSGRVCTGGEEICLGVVVADTGVELESVDDFARGDTIFACK